MKNLYNKKDLQSSSKNQHKRKLQIKLKTGNKISQIENREA